jgi:hypothetical protein
MPLIEIDINKVKDDPIIIKLGEFELKVKPNFTIKDQKMFHEIERDIADPEIPKKQLMLLFDLDEKQFEELAEAVPYQLLKEATMEAWSQVNGVAFMEKKTQELKSSKSSQPFPVYSPSETSKESKKTTVKE